MEMIQLESINCRGLQAKMKRLDFFDKAQGEKVNVLCLQETHLINDDLKILKEEWNINYFISGNVRNAGGGGLIAVDNNVEWKIHDNKIDKEGRYIILDMEVIDIAGFLLINIYAPNEDSPIIFENLFCEIENMNIKNLIITGDWNLVNDFKSDTLNYKKIK